VYSLARGSDIVTDLTIFGWGLMKLFWGTASQNAASRLQAANNEYGEDHPAYKRIFYVLLFDFLFGRERTSAPNVEIICQRVPAQSVVTGAAALNVDGQANLISHAAELLTSNSALGMAAAELEGTTFQGTADAMDAKNGLTAASPLLDAAEPMRTIFAGFGEMTNAFLRWNPGTRKIEAGYFPIGTVPGSYTTLTVNDLAEMPEPDAQGWDVAKTRAFVVYNARTRGFKRTSDKADDGRVFRVVKQHRPITLQRPHITRQTQAIQHAAEYLRVQGGPQLDDGILVRREKGRAIRPGDYVLLDIDLEPGGATLNQFFRVIAREIPFKGPIRLRLDADETLAAEAGAAQDASDVEVDLVVDAIANLRVVEAPVQLSELAVDHVAVLAERPNEKQQGFQLWFDTVTNGTFQVIGDSRGWATRATLRSDITNSATSVPITLPAQVDDERITATTNDLNAADDTLIAFLVEKSGSAVKADADEYQWVEVVSISAIALVSGSDYNLTVLRGRQQTSGRAFTSANCEVWIIPRSSLATFHHKKFADLRENRIEGASPDTAYFRIAPYTADDSRDLADCSSVAYQFAKSSPAGPVLALTAPTSSVVAYPQDWVTSTAYTAGTAPINRVWHGGAAYRCILNHTSGASSEPGVGGSWATYWVAEAAPYPYEFDVTGTWTDPNQDMVAAEMLVRKSGGSDVVDEDDNFAPAGLVALSETVHIAETGTWFITLIGTDATGLTTKRILTVDARGSNTQVAKPKFKWAGKKARGTEWNKYGKFKLKCATPGAAIYFQNRVAEDRDWALSTSYIAGAGRWNGGVFYLCYVNHTSAALTEPGGGANWNDKWKAAVAASAWATSTVYVAGDKRTNTYGSHTYSFMCILGHTSGASTEPGVGTSWETNWVFAEADGTLHASIWHLYDESNEGFDYQPYGWQPTDNNTRQLILAEGRKTSYTTSEIDVLLIRFKRIGVFDPAP
jgi:hypothetical protein